MIQIKSYTVEEVFAAMDQRGRLPDGNKFKPTSARLILFRTKGLTCVTCGIVGSVFILETHHESVTPHMNLYAKDADGELVLMTKDHIHPKSRGGANHLDNYQTMCSTCNSEKSDTV